jgi:hypothetical protein
MTWTHRNDVFAGAVEEQTVDCGEVAQRTAQQLRLAVHLVGDGKAPRHRPCVLPPLQHFHCNQHTHTSHVSLRFNEHYIFYIAPNTTLITPQGPTLGPLLFLFYIRGHAREGP